MIKTKTSRILVVDDDTPIRNLLRSWLEHDGYEVSDAPNGLKAMELFRQCPSDLVICDMFMAEMDGIEMIRGLKMIDPGVRILAISGGAWRGGLDILEVGKLLGAAEVLAKPFNLSECLASVRQILSVEATDAATEIDATEVPLVTNGPTCGA